MLKVPVGDKEETLYVVRSVIVHDGHSEHHGHYYTYIPDPSSVDSRGYPQQWVKASDSSVHVVPSWSRVRDDIAIQGVMYIYDKVEPSGML